MTANEVEVAKRKVWVVYPKAIFYRGICGHDSVILNTDKRPWFAISTPNDCGDDWAAWLDAASRLPKDAGVEEPTKATKRIASIEEAAMRNKPFWYQAAKRVLLMFQGGHNPTESQLDKLQAALDEFDCAVPGDVQEGSLLPVGAGEDVGLPRLPHRPEWHTISDDGDECNVYPEDAATEYMNTLERQLLAARKEIAELENHYQDYKGLITKCLGAGITFQGDDDPLTNERAEKAEAALAVMTEDRNLWQQAHDEDCPNKAALAQRDEEIEKLREALLASQYVDRIERMDTDDGIDKDLLDGYTALILKHGLKNKGWGTSQQRYQARDLARKIRNAALKGGDK